MKAILKGLRDTLLDAIAAAEHFSFPEYYPWWRIKRDMLFGYYEVEVGAFFKRHVKPGMVVMDVGANIGYFTVILTKLVGPTGRVYAFEPDEENYRVLVANTRRYPWVRVLKLAVSDRDGSSDFYHVHGAVGIHSMLPADNADKRHVETVSLDAFAAREGLSRIDALKVDVEGAEPLVFAGMRHVLGAKPMVVFEYTPETSDALMDTLTSAHKVYALASSGVTLPLKDMALRFGKRPYANVVLADEL